MVLYQGDATEVVRQFKTRSFDLVFTDPPYGHNNNNNGDLISRWEAALGRGKYVRGVQDRPIANDDADNAGKLARWLFAISAELLKRPGCCCCCCCGGGGPDPQFARWSLWMDEFLQFKQMVIWDKGKIGMGWHYRRSYETVLVGNTPGRCKWFGGQSTENIIRPGDYGIRKIIPRAHHHPTTKPVQLAAHFIRLHTEPGDWVLDPFAGSGTTLIAAKQLGRQAVGVELDRNWCEFAAKQLADTEPSGSDPRETEKQ